MLCIICSLLVVGIVSCENEDENMADQSKVTTSLGEQAHITLEEVDKIERLSYDKRLISVEIVNPNSLIISPRMAGRTLIDVFDNKNKSKRIDVVTPSDVFVVERYILDVKLNDYPISESIKKEMNLRAFTSHSEFYFDRDSVFVLTILNDEVREEVFRGFYHFNDSIVEIENKQEKFIFKYDVNYNNIKKNVVFIEDLTDHFKSRYPNVEIESVFCIYKVTKQRLPG